jgi:hypothetical protein
VTHVHRKCQRLMFQGKEIMPEVSLRSAIGQQSQVVLTMLVREDIFPEKLGPFCGVQTPLGEKDFKIPSLSYTMKEEGFYWELKPDALERHGLQGVYGDCLTGQTSPVHPLALNLQERQRMQIPHTAKDFIWSYPIANRDVLHEDVYSMEDWQSPGGIRATKSFFGAGGFMYLNAAAEVVHVQTFGPADPTKTGWEFGPARPWRPEWTRALVRNGRFHKMDIKQFKDTGVESYCWLQPDEILYDDDLSALELQPEVPYGGFAYLFHSEAVLEEDDTRKLDRYFAMSPSENDGPATPSDGEFKVFSFCPPDGPADSTGGPPDVPKDNSFRMVDACSGQSRATKR